MSLSPHVEGGTDREVLKIKERNGYRGTIQTGRSTKGDIGGNGWKSLGGGKEKTRGTTTGPSDQLSTMVLGEGGKGGGDTRAVRVLTVTLLPGVGK